MGNALERKIFLAFVVGVSAVGGIESGRCDNVLAPLPKPSTSSAPLEPRSYLPSPTDTPATPTSITPGQTVCEAPIYQGYKSFCSPSEFEIDYPSSLKQVKGTDSFAAKTDPSDFPTRARVIKTPRTDGIIQTPALIHSPYIKENKNAKRERLTAETISGMTAVRIDYTIPKRENIQDTNGFEEEVHVVTFIIAVNENGKLTEYDIEFTAPSSVFTKVFPEGDIERMAGSFKLTHALTKATPPPPVPVI